MAVRSGYVGQVQIRPSEIRARVELTSALWRGQQKAISKASVFFMTEVSFNASDFAVFPPKLK